MFYLCDVYVSVCVYARYVWAGLEARPQRKALGLLDLELQVVMNHPLWILRMKLRSSARAAKGL